MLIAMPCLHRRQPRFDVRCHAIRRSRAPVRAPKPHPSDRYDRKGAPDVRARVALPRESDVQQAALPEDYGPAYAAQSAVLRRPMPNMISACEPPAPHRRPRTVRHVLKTTAIIGGQAMRLPSALPSIVRPEGSWPASIWMRRAFSASGSSRCSEITRRPSSSTASVTST
jgi:hypothetical protein